MSKLQLNKLKSRVKNGTEITVNLSSKVFGDSNDETNFSHKFLLTNTQVSKIRKAFANGSSANIKLSKTKSSKMIHLGGFDPIEPLGVLMNPASILLKTVRKLRDSGVTLTNEEIKDIIKVISSLQNRGILLKENTRKIISQQGWFLKFCRPLTSVGLPLMKNILTPLVKSVLVPLVLTAAASATDAAIQNNNFVSGYTLVFSNEEIDVIKKQLSLSRAMVFW